MKIKSDYKGLKYKKDMFHDVANDNGDTSHKVKFLLYIPSL